MIDRIVGGIFILIAAAALGHAYTLAVPFAADPVGPRVFPMIVATTLGLSGIAICVRPGQITLEFGDWRRVIAILAAAIIYPFLLVPLGFITATALLCFVSALAFRARALPAAISASVTAVFFFVMLDMLLDLPLPRGPLGI
jgi:putative tricarboxylic transport membrane protein